jgi:hypothetical protein
VYAWIGSVIQLVAHRYGEEQRQIQRDANLLQRAWVHNSEISYLRAKFVEERARRCTAPLGGKAAASVASGRFARRNPCPQGRRIARRVACALVCRPRALQPARRFRGGHRNDARGLHRGAPRPTHGTRTPKCIPRFPTLSLPFRCQHCPPTTPQTLPDHPCTHS